MSDRGVGPKISLKEARGIVLGAAVETGAESVRFNESLFRILAKDVFSGIDNPPFDRAMMDGYAVVSSDTAEATSKRPVSLRIVGSISIGDAPGFTVKKGEAARIMTGAPVPEGADCVLRVEDSKEKDEMVRLFSSIEPSRDISPIGEDVKRGGLLLKKGRLLKPQDLGILAATGNHTVSVKKKPRVLIASTGSELLEPGEEMRPGSIYDINTYTVSALVENLGGMPEVYGIIKDDELELERLLKSDFDVLILSGATSVGEKDFVPNVIKRCGSILFHGVNVRPGSPVGFGIVEGKPVFMLPGFPVSCFTTVELLVTPFLQKMLGREVVPPYPAVTGVLKEPIRSQKGTSTFVRAQITKKGDVFEVRPIAHKGSSLISTLTAADGYVLVDEEREGLAPGESVTAYLF